MTGGRRVRVWVKICGIATLEAATACAEAGADAVGFVFAPSSRRVSAEDARRLAAALPDGIVRVGVFVNAPWQEVAEIRECVGLDVVQLHGAETPAYCALLGSTARVVKAFGVGAAADPWDIAQAVEPYAGKVFACLLDSCARGTPDAREGAPLGPQGGALPGGGTGRAWDWALLREFAAASRAAGRPVERVIVAGGLAPGNVAEALELARPWGVDASSGVETGGLKDVDKIRDFVSAVRRWEHGQLTR